MDLKGAAVYLALLVAVIIILFTIVGYGNREIERMKADCESRGGAFVKGYGEYLCLERK